jgi:AcrR family transcriptional regulator
MPSVAAHARSAKRETTDDRRRAIAAATRALIVEKGFEGLRTRDIAERVGINIATLHYHVPSKEALIELVAETMRAEFREQGLVRPRAHLSPAERLEHEFYDFREMITERQELVGVMSEMMERARRDEAVRAGVNPMLGYWRQMVADILAAGRDDGTFRADLDPEPAAQMMIGTLIGYCRSPDQTPAKFERLCAELRRAVRNPIASNQTPKARLLSKSDRTARHTGKAKSKE